MSKQTVRFTSVEFFTWRGTDTIRANVIPIDHPSDWVTNGVPATTTEVSDVERIGPDVVKFETKNTIYVLEKE